MENDKCKVVLIRKLPIAFFDSFVYNNIRCLRRKQLADVAQSVERILGKDEVTGSNPVISSMGSCRNARSFCFIYRCEPYTRGVA